MSRRPSPVIVGLFALFAALPGAGCGSAVPTEVAHGSTAPPEVSVPAFEAGAATMAGTAVTDPWTRQFGTASFETADSVSVGPDGSVLVAGHTSGTLPGQPSTGGNAGGPDAFVRKYDAAGNEVWTRQFGSASDDRAQSVSVGPDGSVLVAGNTSGTLPGHTKAGDRDAFVRKYDAAGNEVWTRQFGTALSVHAASVSVGPDGSVLVAGEADGTLPGQTSAGHYDAFVRKYDSAGNEVWTRQFGARRADNTTDERAWSVSVGPDGSVLVAGDTWGTLPGQAPVGIMDAFVRKYDAAGNEVWTHQFGTDRNESAVSVSVGSDGSVLVAGNTYGSLPGQTNAGELDAFVRKYDAAGNEVWTHQFGAGGADHALSVSVGPDSGVLVTGYVLGNWQPAYVRKYDAAGNEAWMRRLGTGNLDFTSSVSVGPDGSVLVAGHTSGTFPGQRSAGYQDAFVMRVAAP